MFLDAAFSSAWKCLDLVSCASLGVGVEEASLNETGEVVEGLSCLDETHLRQWNWAVARQHYCHGT